MSRILAAAVAFAVLSPAAGAHFVFIVPQKDGKSIQVVFSDSLEPDEAIPAEKFAGVKLSARMAGGKESSLECKKGDHALTASAAGAEAVHGTLVYGVTAREGSPAFLLVYHPKAVIGTPGKSATVGAKAELEAVPVVAGGKVRFRLLAKGEPVAGAEGSAMLPGGKSAKLKADKDGYTAEFDAAGRYGLWLRHAEKKAGEHGGKKYEEVRHYATLVFDLAGKP